MRASRSTSCASGCRLAGIAVCGLLALAAVPSAMAHGVAEGDSGFLSSNEGAAVAVYAYLGAKHMVTGLDHLLFLAGVIFFLHRLRDVALYATLFAVGHSITLLVGVLGEIHANAFAVDAIIGLSIVYKAFDNMGGFRTLGIEPYPRVAVLGFGLCHGFGLATKLQTVTLSGQGLIANILSFNAGVELGQLLALTFMVIVFSAWRRSSRFFAQAFVANWLLLTAGILLTGYHAAGVYLA
jgi:hypothetical protein